VFAPGGTVCNPGSGDLCDPDETCSGSPGQACPSDTVASDGTLCRAGSGDLCDPDETCTGVADAPCPADSVSGASVTCRPAADVCDIAENCTGVASQPCPADAVEPGTTECRAAVATCDVPENCTGTGVACPGDTGQPDTDSDTVCDAIDNCDTTGNPGQQNADADPLGDVCDPCTNIAPTGQDKAKLTLTKLLAPMGDDKVTFKGFFTNVPASPTIDPITNGMRFLITDSAGNTPVDITIPGGEYSPATRSGWRVNGSGTTWTYNNAGSIVPLIDGIQKMQLKTISITSGKYKFNVKGKNSDYPVNEANLPADRHHRDRCAVRRRRPVRRGDVPGGAPGQAELRQRQRRQDRQVQVAR